MNYAFEHHGVQFTPDGRTSMTRVQAEERNKALDTAVVAKWQSRPDKFMVYVTGDKVTTWTGIVLGDVLTARKIGHNMSPNMVALRVRGNNGATYYGRYGADWSQVCRLHKLTKGD